MTRPRNLRSVADRADQIDQDDIRYRRYIPSSWRGALGSNVTKRALQAANLLRAARASQVVGNIEPLGFCFGPEDQARWAKNLKSMAFRRLTSKKVTQR